MDDQTIRNSLPEMYANRIVACTSKAVSSETLLTSDASALSQVKDPSALDKIVTEMETTNKDNVRTSPGISWAY